MTAKSRAELKAENAADFPNNTARLISPASLRGQLDDIVDSMIMAEDPPPSGPVGPQGPRGFPGGGTSSNAHYQNYAAAAASTPVDVDTIETLSYATSGDGGGAIYRRVGGPADLQSDDGAWWELVPQGPLRAVQLGVVADANTSGNDVWAGTDNEPALKTALYKHVYESKGAGVDLPLGDIYLGRGIHVGYGTSFKSGCLRGSGRAHGVDPSTTIVWTFTDEPAVSIQGGRNTRIENLSFRGLNSSYWETHGFGTYVYDGSVGDDTLLATWMRPTWPAQVTSRYAPACAIAVDPRVGPADATYHYRDVDYPAAMGAVPQYGKTLTSGVTIENVGFYGCGNAAVVIHPNKNSDGNGDFVRLKSCMIYAVPVGISIGQTQARLTSFDSVDLAACHTAITTRLHGLQNGVFAEAWNCCFSGIQLFDLGDTGISGHITLNFYSEETWRIGDVRPTTASALKLILHNCKLSFECQEPSSDGPNSRGVPATILGGKNMMPIEFNGGLMNNYFGCFVIEHSCRGVTIDGTLMQPRSPIASIQEKAFLNATAGGLVFERLAFSEELGEIHPQFAYWNLDTGAMSAIGRTMLGKRWRSNRTLCTPIWTERHSSTAQGDLDDGVFISNNRIRAYDIPSFWLAGGSLSITDLVLTGTSPVSWNDASHHLFGPEPGDFMLHDVSQTVFVCMTRAGHVCTFKQVNNYRGLAARDPIDLTTGFFWCANTRYYSPFWPIYGIITSGSPVITDAGSVPQGGGTQVATNLSPDIAVGDYIAVDAAMTPYLAQYSNRITAIDETAKTITLNGLAIGSSTTRVRIGTFIRTPVA